VRTVPGRSSGLIQIKSVSLEFYAKLNNHKYIELGMNITIFVNNFKV